MDNPELDPTIGHLYRTGDLLAGFLWADIRDSRRLAREVHEEFSRIVAQGDFPSEYYMDGYALEFVSADVVVIEPNWTDFEPQTAEVSRLLEALDLIAREGDSI